ncbi:MAG: HAD-IIA family hydrolase [Cytophagales bacterium]|nr:HAD-IIA family hydrolase [Cytophagales bacterium]
MEIDRFEEIAKGYKVIFFDAYGVLKNSTGSIEGVDRTFAWLEENNKPFYILTNDASRSPELLMKSYHERGHYNIKESQIISSGMLSRQYLGYKVTGGKVVYVGPPSSAFFIESKGLEALHISDVDLKDIEDITAVAMMDDEGFDWQVDINKLVNLLRFHNVPVIVANTDLGFPVSGNEISIAIGGLAEMIQNLVGKHFIKFGKPDAQMFNFAFAHFEEDGVEAGRNEVLMVGDTLTTDIIGGNKYGLDTALVLTGNTIKEEAPTLISSTGIRPTYILESAGIF